MLKEGVHSSRYKDVCMEKEKEIKKLIQKTKDRKKEIIFTNDDEHSDDDNDDFTHIDVRWIDE